MSIWESLFYGILQGIGEFLPISSSGHLAIAANLTGRGAAENLPFAVLLHLGTLLAVFAVYRKDIGALILAGSSLLRRVWRREFHLSAYTEHERLALMLIIATLPLLPAALLDGYVEALSASTAAVGIILMGNALLLRISDRFARQANPLTECTPKKALAIGLWQLFAIFPGISRSGATVTGALVCKIDRPRALRFSFLLSIPAILGASILKLPAFFRTVGSQGNGQLLIYLAGALAATLSGIGAIKLLTYLSKQSNFKIFSRYCLLAGLFAVIWEITH